MAAARTAPDDQGVTFVELFFDLVFVFAVTDVTGLLHHDLTAGGVARFVLVFWLVWWAWTQYTWALNSADTTHHGVQAATLASVVLAFAMAIGVGRAYEGSGLWERAPVVGVAAVLVLLVRPVSPAAVLAVGVAALAAVVLIEERAAGGPSPRRVTGWTRRDGGATPRTR